MGTHQAPQHRLQEAFDLLMYPTTCLWWRKYGIITHGINPFLARFFFFCKNYPSFFPPWQPLFLLVGINDTQASINYAIQPITSGSFPLWLLQMGSSPSRPLRYSVQCAS